jgi:SAM-dependent methyltransferase
VLEIRSRTGAILQGLQRLYGAEVAALAIFESQQFLLQTVYGIRAEALIDFEEFRILYEGQFDLIVSNHMLTHALSPRQFLATIREHMRPGGYLYLYNEPDDAEFTDYGQSMFNVLNPFHMQAYDRSALMRALAANGFAIRFIGHIDLNFYALAQMVDAAPFSPLSEADRAARLAAYARARDVAVLRAPKEVRPRFAAEWDGVLERAVVSGLADLDGRGRISVRPPKQRRAVAADTAYQ